MVLNPTRQLENLSAVELEQNYGDLFKGPNVSKSLHPVLRGVVREVHTNGKSLRDLSQKKVIGQHYLQPAVLYAMAIARAEGIMQNLPDDSMTRKHYDILRRYLTLVFSPLERSQLVHVLKLPNMTSKKISEITEENENSVSQISSSINSKLKLMGLPTSLSTLRRMPTYRLFKKHSNSMTLSDIEQIILESYLFRGKNYTKTAADIPGGRTTSTIHNYVIALYDKLENKIREVPDSNHTEEEKAFLDFRRKNREMLAPRKANELS